MHAEAADLRDRRDRLYTAETPDVDPMEGEIMAELTAAILAERAAGVARDLGMSTEADDLGTLASELTRSGFLSEAFAAHDELVASVYSAETIEELAAAAIDAAAFIEQTAQALEQSDLHAGAAWMYLSAAKLYGLNSVVERASGLEESEQTNLYSEAAETSRTLGLHDLSAIFLNLSTEG